MGYDRKVKQRLYARARIPEYWILAVRDACLEVYREPGEDGYQSVTRLGAGETVAPLMRPDARIAGACPPRMKVLARHRAMA